MDKEASSLLILVEASERMSKEMQSRLSPAPRSAQHRTALNRESFTNWDNEMRIQTYIDRREATPVPVVRCASEAKRRPGLLLPSTRHWREDFPELDKFLCSRTRAITYPLSKPSNPLCQSTRLMQWKPVPSKDHFSHIIFPTKKHVKTSRSRLRKSPEIPFTVSLPKTSHSEAVLRRSRLIASRSVSRTTQKPSILTLLR